MPTTRHGFDLVSPEDLAERATDAGFHSVSYTINGGEALIEGRA